MVIQQLQRFLWMVILVAAQMLVFNHVHLFGYCTPLPFVYLLLLFPLGSQRWSVLVWGFVCGLLSDIVSLTPGVGAAAMTIAAFVQPPLLMLTAPKDATEDMQPGYDVMGFWGYVRYAAILTFIFAVAYFTVLAFSFQHLADLAISFASSWLLTLIFCLAFEGFRGRRSE